MANVSPYLKSLCLVTAVKLVNLCEAFSSPRFLYSAPNHPQYIAFLLEILNNFIQYQYEGACTHGHTHMCLSTHTHKRTHTHTCAHAHTHTPPVPSLTRAS